MDPSSIMEFSDDEEVMPQQEAGEHSWEHTTLRFGKWRDHTLGDMIKTSKKRSYLKYLLKWDKLYEDLRQDINTALAIYEDAKKQRQAAAQ